MSDYVDKEAIEKYMQKIAHYEVDLHGIKEVIDQAIELLSVKGKDNQDQVKKLLKNALNKFWG